MKLSAKELLFCYHYLRLQNPKEAAIAAGYPSCSASNAGASLLMRKNIAKKIKDFSRTKSLDVLSLGAKAGFTRLAFGSVGDALKILACEDEDLSSLSFDELDLFNIQEIKKVKGGGFEIKFFDRLKALEKLYELGSTSEESQNSSFYSALEKGAAALNDAASDKHE